MFAEALFQEHYVITDKHACSAEKVWALLRETHWACDRSLQTVKTSIQNSMCFFLMKDLTLIGFARVITDHATFAYLCDVVVDPKQRDQGCGYQLVSHIMNHPNLRAIPQWRLKTTYAKNFYEQFGFKELQYDVTHMEYYPQQNKKV